MAFLAELGQSLVDPAKGEPIVFDVTYLNDGSAYNNKTGKFITPVAGVYHFTLELSSPTKSDKSGLHVSLMKTDTLLGYIYLDANDDRWLKRAATSTVYLAKGDDIWAKVRGRTEPGTIAGCCYHSIFSGFLIKAD